jgi:cytochrome P450
MSCREALIVYNSERKFMSQRLNLFDPDFRENPYPHYARLRRDSPVCQVDPNGFWMLTRHEDIVAAFKNPELFSSSALRMAGAPPWLGRSNPLVDSMIAAEPQRHGRLRNLVSRAFTNVMVGRMEAYARDVVMRLTDMLFQAETVDFIPEFALAMPANLMALLLGVDPSLQKRFKRWRMTSAARRPWPRMMSCGRSRCATPSRRWMSTCGRCWSGAGRSRRMTW